jgi:hypothetical protein
VGGDALTAEGTLVTGFKEGHPDKGERAAEILAES